jgi:hypothetical protein
MSQTMEPSGSHAGCKGSAVAKVPLGDVELSKDSGTAGVLSNWSRSSGGDTVCFDTTALHAWGMDNTCLVI